jgi:hypothetical protein
MTSTDALVLNCVVSHNRPFNTQLVADLLATKGVKKPAAQRSLDSLAGSGKLRMKARSLLGAACFPLGKFLRICVPGALSVIHLRFSQEFGKTKIYYPNRDTMLLGTEVCPPLDTDGRQLCSTVAAAICERLSSLEISHICDDINHHFVRRE